MKTFLVTQTYWDTREEDNEYSATVEVEADTPEEAEQKACLEGLFDDEYEVPFEYLGVSDVCEVEEIEE